MIGSFLNQPSQLTVRGHVCVDNWSSSVADYLWNNWVIHVDVVRLLIISLCVSVFVLIIMDADLVARID